MRFNAIYQKVPVGFIGFVEELPGANAQGETLEEARASLQEAIELILEANRRLASGIGCHGLSRRASRANHR